MYSPPVESCSLKSPCAVMSTCVPVIPAVLVIAPLPNVPAKVTPVAPVGMEITSVSASFLIVTSLVEPCPVKISPSADVYPIVALSPAEVSAVASTVVPVITPEDVIAPEPTVPKPETFPDVSNV